MNISDSTDAHSSLRYSYDILEALLIIVLNLTILNNFKIGLSKPDLLIVYCAYKALTRPLSQLLPFVFCIGLLCDMYGAFPRLGLHALTLLIVVFVIRIFRSHIPRQNKLLPILFLVFCASLAHKILHSLFIAIVHEISWRYFIQDSLVTAIYTSAVVGGAVLLLTFSSLLLYGEHPK